MASLVSKGRKPLCQGEREWYLLTQEAFSLPLKNIFSYKLWHLCSFQVSMIDMLFPQFTHFIIYSLILFLLTNLGTSGVVFSEFPAACSLHTRYRCYMREEESAGLIFWRRFRDFTQEEILRRFFRWTMGWKPDRGGKAHRHEELISFLELLQ